MAATKPLNDLETSFDNPSRLVFDGSIRIILLDLIHHSDALLPHV